MAISIYRQVLPLAFLLPSALGYLTATLDGHHVPPSHIPFLERGDSPPTGCHTDCPFFHDPINFWDALSPTLPNVPAGSFSIFFDWYDDHYHLDDDKRKIRAFGQMGTSQYSEQRSVIMAGNSSDLLDASVYGTAKNWEFAHFDFATGVDLGIHLGNWVHESPDYATDKMEGFWAYLEFGGGKIVLKDDPRCLVFGHYRSQMRCVFKIPDANKKKYPWNQNVEPVGGDDE